jgi:hypothetical protein
VGFGFRAAMFRQLRPAFTAAMPKVNVNYHAPAWAGCGIQPAVFHGIGAPEPVLRKIPCMASEVRAAILLAAFSSKENAGKVKAVTGFPCIGLIRI